jgi:hypothetical protein
LREKRRLRLFENRVLGRIFWPKMEEVKGEWRNIFRVINREKLDGRGISKYEGEQRRIQGIGEET